MKKSAVLIVVCVVAAIIGLPPVFGTRTESQFYRRIDAINDNGVLLLDVRSFERRWFTSTVTIDAGLSPAYLAQLERMVGPGGQAASDSGVLDQTFPIQADVAHGPVIVRDGLYIGLAKVIAGPASAQPGTVELEEDLGIPYAFEFRGRSGLLGGLRFDAEIPASDYADGINEVVFSGAQIEGSWNGDELISHFQAASLFVSNPIAAASINGISFSGDNRILSRHLVLGSAEFLIEQMLISDRTFGGEPLFEAGNIAIRGETDRNDDGPLVSGTMTYAVDTVSAGERFRFTDGEVAVAFENVDAEAMSDYVEAAQGLGDQAAGNPAPITVLLPAIHRLLAAEPLLSFDPIRFLMDDEPFEASVHVRTNPAALPDTVTGIQEDIALLVEALYGVTDAVASKTFARRIAVEIIKAQLAASGAGGPFPGDIDGMAEAQAEIMLGALSAQGVLEEDGESYRITFAFEDGQFSLNGNPLPFLFGQ